MILHNHIRQCAVVSARCIHERREIVAATAARCASQMQAAQKRTMQAASARQKLIKNTIRLSAAIIHQKQKPLVRGDNDDKTIIDKKLE